MRNPRWKKLLDWRRHGVRNGPRHAGCQGCDWCVPESSPSFKVRDDRMWRRTEFSNADVLYFDHRVNQ